MKKTRKALAMLGIVTVLMVTTAATMAPATADARWTGGGGCKKCK